MTEGFQLESAGPAAYERFLVPAFFAPCAELLLALAPPGTGERVLDLACGTGIVARRAAELVGPAGRVTGVDVNDAMIAVATRSAESRSGLIEWSTADAAALPLLDDSIDIACCQQGLQFFADRTSALRELRRVIVPGGRLLLAVWRPLEDQPAFAQLVRLLERHLGTAAAGIMRAPFAGPGPEELRTSLAAGGFPVAHVESAVVTARFPSVSSFLQQEAAGSPLAESLAQAAPGARAALLADLETSLAPYVDDLGLALPTQTWLVLARAESCPSARSDQVSR